jgi:hypothetical protein
MKSYGYKEVMIGKRRSPSIFGTRERLGISDDRSGFPEISMIDSLLLEMQKIEFHAPLGA